MMKSYKYRIYPNREQEVLIQKTFGCCRFVYNQTLAYKKEKFEKENISIGKFDCRNYCTRVLKDEYPWLREVDKCALANSVFDMDSAYRNFFKSNFKYPKFKSKKNCKKSYRTTCSYGRTPTIEVFFEEGKIKLPKLRMVKIKFHRTFVGKIKSVTISQNPSGKYFASILVDTINNSTNETENRVGIDLGIKDLIITSDGEKFDNICTTKKYEDKLAKEQRKLSHKAKGGKNWNKQRIKVARIHEKIHNTRVDNLHKISHKLISENQVIVSEDLAVSNMVKNHNLAKSIIDCSWGELTRQLSYKAEWNGKKYIKIGRYVKSSQTCNVCGYVNQKTKDLSVREWKCPQCGTVHDRDVNAAINILNEGLKQIS